MSIPIQPMTAVQPIAAAMPQALAQVTDPAQAALFQNLMNQTQTMQSTSMFSAMNAGTADGDDDE